MRPAVEPLERWRDLRRLAEAGAFFEGVGLAGRILVGRLLPEQAAQVEEMLLIRAALVTAVQAPFGRELDGGEGHRELGLIMCHELPDKVACELRLKSA